MFALILASVLAGEPRCGPLDLPMAQALALARSDEVGIKRSELAAAEADLAIAKAARWIPEATLTLIGGLVPSAKGDLRIDTAETGAAAGGLQPPRGSNRSFRDLGPFGRVDVNVLQPIWTWGQLTDARQAAEAGSRARSLLVTDTGNQIRQRVRQLFYGVVLTRRLLGIAGDVESALKDVDARITESVKKHDEEIAPEDRYRVELFRSELVQRRAEAEKAQRLARVGLAATLAIEEPALRLQEVPLPDLGGVQLPDAGAARAQAETSRPDLLAFDQGLAAKEAQARAAWAAMLPSVGLGATFAYSRAPGRTTQTNPFVADYFNALGFGVAIAVRQNLSFFLLRTQAQKVEAELGTLRKQREGLARLAHVEVDQALAELQAALTKRGAAKAALASGRSWFRSATLNFGVGVGDARAVIDAYSGYVKTQLDDAQSTYDVLLAQGRLDQVTGHAPPGTPPSACTMP